MGFNTTTNKKQQHVDRKMLSAPVDKSGPEGLFASKPHIGAPVPHVLVVEDDEASGAQLEAVYLHNDYNVSVVHRAEDALLKLAGLNVDLCVTDLRLPGMSGVDLVKHIRSNHPDVPVIVITGYGDIEIATDVLKLGARDFFAKPFSLVAIKESTECVLREVELATEIRHLRRSLKEFYNFGGMISKTPAMHELFETIRSVSDTDLTVSVEGETGTGKELVARAIHSLSSRRMKPFIAINCAGIMESLLESELFGYEKGAFTGAYRQKPGKFELANGGTIFLDEIGDISPSLQAKLLQVLQDREFSRLGGKRDIKVDVRVLVATNKDIEEAVAEGRFREDLYYRLNVVSIIIPPLRERKTEIPIFVEYFLNKFSEKYQKKPRPISDPFMRMLMAHNWSGNIRELQNVIQRYVVLGNEEEILSELELQAKNDDLFLGEKKDDNSSFDSQPSLKQINREAARRAEAKIIVRALEMTNYNRKKAAELLNISYKSLLYKIKECGIQKHFHSETA
jgi:two-component system response regulator AtoC